MAVPCGDERDFKFANHFNIPITNILGDAFNGTEPNATKDAKLTNSGFLNGVVLRDAIQIVVDKLEEMGIGKRKINYRMRDAAFSRQRYWGEPFPIVWKNGIAYPLPEKNLPLVLPEMDEIKPGKNGDGPLSNNKDWITDVDKYFEGVPSSIYPPLGDGGLESSTMPGYAGSSWYFLRYMDNHNDTEFASRQATDYWNQVDLYIGGTEHAVGHLLYSRLWTKVLYDLGHLGFDEPFKKLLNQGMITGVSQFDDEMFVLRKDERTPSIDNPPKNFAYFDTEGKIQFFNLPKSYRRIVYSFNLGSKIRKEVFNNLKDGDDSLRVVGVGDFGGKRIPIDYVENDLLKLDQYLIDFSEAKEYLYVTEDGYFADGKYFAISENIDERFFTKPIVEKMSKSKRNVVNPDEIITKFGADTFRMYEMFLGPIEQSKPWDTKGIEGVHRFLKKLWRLFFDEHKGKVWNEAEPTADELKILHRTIKKIEDDTERFSFNTAVSAFMVCVNDLADIKCHKRTILEPILILLTPYAPHIAEELWHILGNETLIIDASFPKFEAKYVVESTKEYPVSINGKVRTNLNLPLDMEQSEVEAAVTSNETVQKWLEGKAPKKIIFVKGRMINVVI